MARYFTAGTVVLSSCVIRLAHGVSLPYPVLGPVEMVVDWETAHCPCTPAYNCTDPNDPDYPDTPPRAYLDAASNVHLWATDAESRPSILTPGSQAWTHNCSVQAPSSLNCSFEAYDYQRWIHSPYMLDGTHAFALVHMEYHGWQCAAESKCTNSNGGDCAMEAIQLWRSDNGGWDWEPAGPGGSIAKPPSNLVVVSPYRYLESMASWNHSELGFGDPTTIVRGRGADSGTFYAIFSASNPDIGLNGYTGLQQRGACIMRSEAPEDPASWRAWDGQGFNVQFLDPYVSPISNVSAHVCAPINSSMIIVSVGWSVAFGAYMAGGFGSYRYPNGTDIPCCGAWLYALSDDLVNWTPPQLIRPNKQEGPFADWEYDPSFLQPRLAPPSAAEASPRLPPLWNWHEQLEADGVYMYYWQANPSGGRDIKRQAISFPGAEPRGAAPYTKAEPGGGPGTASAF